MTVGKWDAEAWHREHRRDTPAARNKKPWTYLVIAAFVLTAASVSATQVFETEKIGVCHSAGDEHVLLVVDEDGFEHGHHRHHHGDYFIGPDEQCAGALPAEQDGDGGTQQNETVPDVDDSVEEVEPVNETVSGEEPANETVANPEPEPQGDVALVQVADQDDKRVWLFLTIQNVGEGNASDVTLVDDLPDLRRSWSLSGDGAKSCVLEDNALRCWFGLLQPGEAVELKLSAYTDRMPCGDAMTNTATVTSADDAETRNDASSASIMARYC